MLTLKCFCSHQEVYPDTGSITQANGPAPAQTSKNQSSCRVKIVVAIAHIIHWGNTHFLNQMAAYGIRQGEITRLNIELHLTPQTISR